MPKVETIAQADPTVRYAKLTLAGETYWLAFDFNGLAVAEEITGLNLLQALRTLVNLSVSQTRGLLYAALLKRQPKTRLLDVGNMMTFEALPQITQALSEALTNAMPEQTENPPEPAPEPAGNP